MNKKAIILLTVLWSVLQFILFLKVSVFNTEEAHKYVYEAYYLNTFHRFSYPHYFLYSFYIILHWLFLKAGVELAGVYTLQLIGSYLSTIIIYKLLASYTSSIKVAVAGTIIWLLCFQYQKFTAFLYTESLFGSFIILHSYWLLTKPKTRNNILILSFLSIGIITIRPTGIIFIPVWIVYLCYILLKQGQKIAVLIISLSTLITMSGLLYFIMNRTDMGFNFMLPFTDNNVLCYIPEKSLQQYHLQLNNSSNAIGALLFYILHNPMHFLHASILKIIAYFGMTRSYYSFAHNLYLQLFYYPIYLLAFSGIWLNRKSMPSWIIYSLIAIFLFTLSIVLTCEDWSNRFMVPITPFIILLGLYGASVLYSKYCSKNKSPL